MTFLLIILGDGRRIVVAGAKSVTVLPAPEPVDASVLIPRIAAAIGTRTFTVKQLLRHGEVDDELAVTLRGIGRKRLGRLLLRSCGQVFDGYEVERRAGILEGGAAIWQINQRVF